MSDVVCERTQGKRRAIRCRPAIEGLEGRQLLSLKVFSVPSASETTRITKGPGGNLFFTETPADKIGKITPAGVVTEFSIPTPNALPTSIATGSDGNVYFTEAGVTNSGGFGALHIGRLTPTGKITEFSLGFSVFAVGGITAGPDGNVYFTVGDNNGEQVGRIIPAGNISFLAVPGGIDPGAITAGPDGNLYFAESSPGAGIGRITTDRRQLFFPASDN
jgi:virginiamycin B lyase